MGYMRHHVIVVTSCNVELLLSAHDAAKEIFGRERSLSPTAITSPTVNGYQSFFVPPDGSKEGWDESEAGDARRAAFVDWLVAAGTSIEWAEVQYGDDDRVSKVVRHSDEGPEGESEP